MKYGTNFLVLSLLTLSVTGNAENGKGMTWGFAALTDFKSGEASVPQWGTLKLGCNTSSGNNSTTNPAGITGFSNQD